MTRPLVVVVGGGLAGCTAALDCADAGAEVVLLERRNRLGGLTWSFDHDNYVVDNGQHVFLRCCDAYLAFLARIGSAGDVFVQDRLDVAVLDPRPGRSPLTARLQRNKLPAPAHLGLSLLGYRHLSVVDRLRIGQAAVALRNVALDDPALDRVTFGEWLAAHAQSPTAIRALWDLITVATINLPASEASATMGAKVFQTGLLTDAEAADIGWSSVPLRRLHGQRCATALDRAGVKVLTRCRVTSVGAGRVTLDDGESWRADAAVVALPHTALPVVLDPSIVATRGNPAGLGTSAIANVHVVYDRPVTDLPFAAAVSGPVHWVFDRTVSSGCEDAVGPGRRQYLAVTISAADAHIGQPPWELADAVVAALADLFPAARAAKVLDTLVTKERTATFRAVPGTAAQRPGPITSVPGVVLAGAWTDTGWPATMEGAVRSGHAAARAALVATRTTRRLPEEVA